MDGRPGWRGLRRRSINGVDSEDPGDEIGCPRVYGNRRMSEPCPSRLRCAYLPSRHGSFNFSVCATTHHPPVVSELMQDTVTKWVEYFLCPSRRLASEIDSACLDERIRTETASMLDLARFEELVANENDQP